MKMPVTGIPRFSKRCTSCTKAKTRCFRESPVCSSCVRRGESERCQYPADAKVESEKPQYSKRCLPCAASKTRCFREPPICSACIRKGRADLCEYPMSARILGSMHVAPAAEEDLYQQTHYGQTSSAAKKIKRKLSTATRDETKEESIYWQLSTEELVLLPEEDFSDQEMAGKVKQARIPQNVRSLEYIRELQIKDGPDALGWHVASARGRLQRLRTERDAWGWQHYQVHAQTNSKQGVEPPEVTCSYCQVAGARWSGIHHPPECPGRGVALVAAPATAHGAPPLTIPTPDATYGSPPYAPRAPLPLPVGVAPMLPPPNHPDQRPLVLSATDARGPSVGPAAEANATVTAVLAVVPGAHPPHPAGPAPPLWQPHHPYPSVPAHCPYPPPQAHHPQPTAATAARATLPPPSPPTPQPPAVVAYHHSTDLRPSLALPQQGSVDAGLTPMGVPPTVAGALRASQQEIGSPIDGGALFPSSLVPTLTPVAPAAVVAVPGSQVVGPPAPVATSAHHDGSGREGLLAQQHYASLAEVASSGQRDGSQHLPASPSMQPVAPAKQPEAVVSWRTEVPDQGALAVPSLTAAYTASTSAAAFHAVPGLLPPSSPRLVSPLLPAGYIAAAPVGVQLSSLTKWQAKDETAGKKEGGNQSPKAVVRGRQGAGGALRKKRAEARARKLGDTTSSTAPKKLQKRPTPATSRAQTPAITPYQTTGPTNRGWYPAHATPAALPQQSFHSTYLTKKTENVEQEAALLMRAAGPPSFATSSRLSALIMDSLGGSTRRAAVKKGSNRQTSSGEVVAEAARPGMPLLPVQHRPPSPPATHTIQIVVGVQPEDQGLCQVVHHADTHQQDHLSARFNPQPQGQTQVGQPHQGHGQLQVQESLQNHQPCQQLVQSAAQGPTHAAPATCSTQTNQLVIGESTQKHDHHTIPSQSSHGGGSHIMLAPSMEASSPFTQSTEQPVHEGAAYLNPGVQKTSQHHSGKQLLYTYASLPSGYAYAAPLSDPPTAPAPGFHHASVLATAPGQALVSLGSPALASTPNTCHVPAAASQFSLGSRVYDHAVHAAPASLPKSGNDLSAEGGISKGTTQSAGGGSNMLPSGTQLVPSVLYLNNDEELSAPAAAATKDDRVDPRKTTDRGSFLVKEADGYGRVTAPHKNHQKYLQQHQFLQHHQPSNAEIAGKDVFGNHPNHRSSHQQEHNDNKFHHHFTTSDAQTKPSHYV